MFNYLSICATNSQRIHTPRFRKFNVFRTFLPELRTTIKLRPLCVLTPLSARSLLGKPFCECGSLTVISVASIRNLDLQCRHLILVNLLRHSFHFGYSWFFCRILPWQIDQSIVKYILIQLHHTVSDF